MSDNNPANRLLSIIQEGQRQKKDQQAVDAWAAILGVPKDNRCLLLSRVGHVMALPGAIKSEIEQLDNVNHNLYLKWLPNVESSFSILNLQIQWKQFIERFNSETTYGIEICGDELSRNRPEKTADPESLQILLNDVNALLAELHEHKLPPELQNFIFEHLWLVKNAVEEYKIRGIHPLEAEVERLTGAIVRNPAVWSRTKDSDFGKQFWKVMGRLAIITTVAIGQLQIGHEVFNALSSGQAEAVQVQNNVNILQVDCESEDDSSAQASGLGMQHDH